MAERGSQATREALWALVLPVVIVGGLKFGIFTPTEAAVDRGGLLARSSALVVYREIKPAELFDLLLPRGEDAPRSSCSWSPRRWSRPG